MENTPEVFAPTWTYLFQDTEEVALDDLVYEVHFYVFRDRLGRLQLRHHRVTIDGRIRQLPNHEFQQLRNIAYSRFTQRRPELVGGA